MLFRSPHRLRWTSSTRPAVRVWAYPRPAVVLGRSGRPDAGIAARARDAGVDLCVRASGGGAVLAGPWLLSASVLLPPDHPLVLPSIARSFGWLGRAYCDWLEALGVRADAATGPDPRRDDPLAWACFAGLSYGEVAVDGRKLVGLSQARQRHGVLFASGLLVSPSPWPLLCTVMGRPAEHADAMARRTVTFAEASGSSAPATALAETLAQPLLDALCAALRVA